MAGCTNLLSLILLFFTMIPESNLLKANGMNISEGNFGPKCIQMERKSLLQFREGLTDPSRKLASWVGKDCCKWKGVRCNKWTGHVIRIDLRDRGNCLLTKWEYGAIENSSCLGGSVSPSLLDLKYLKYLDLSINDFQGIPIPNFLGSIEKLRYLNLSLASFSGMVPPHLGNLTNLRHLDLSKYSYSFSLSGQIYGYNDPGAMWVSGLYWVSGLTFLEYLNLGGVNLTFASTNWLQVFNMLPCLSELHLVSCQLHNFPQSLSNLNFTSLSLLDLFYNCFNSSIPQWLFNISTLTDLSLPSCCINSLVSNVLWQNACNLRSLNLGSNTISGDVGELVGGLSYCSNSSLETLYLYNNKLSGQLPESLGFLKKLRFLVLSHNSISGSIPESVGKLAELTSLFLNENFWDGVLSENHLDGLKKLKLFAISSSNKLFTVNVSSEWIPPFSLIYIHITDCGLGPKFPAWLKTQRELDVLHLRNVSIADTIPHWFWNSCLQMSILDFSGNKIGGMLPNVLEFSLDRWVVVDLSFNLLTGQVPLWANVTHLHLASNLLSGSIPTKIGQVMSYLEILNLSGNRLSGSIPLSISKMKYLEGLDLSNNHFSGRIQNQWRDLQQLTTIDLSRNFLSGSIPGSFGLLPRLNWLRLSKNNLSGELPRSLQNCKKLTALDLGENRFSGNMPEWIGESLSSLWVLRMNANMFYGNIPKQLCLLSSLRVLSLSGNNLSGFIPSCLKNLSGMNSLSYYYTGFYNEYVFTPEMEFVLKGRSTMFTKTLSLLNMIDLASNNLRGEIPEEITNLSNLGTLNLSHNQLTGKIPENIGSLRWLETLDLSCNNLSGPIPLSMSSMTSLNYLNLSHNNLSGQIPSSTQFQTLNDSSIYAGNPLLCGSPLPTKCLFMPIDGDSDNQDEDGNVDKHDKMWLYLSIVLGYAVGFWAVVGTLVIKRSWRHNFFSFMDMLVDRVSVVVEVNMSRVGRMMKHERN